MICPRLSLVRRGVPGGTAIAGFDLLQKKNWKKMKSGGGGSCEWVWR